MTRDAPDPVLPTWDANAEAWTRAVRDGRVESRSLATDGAIVDAVARRSPQRVLDVGCGEGWLCRALADRGIEVVGVDGSATLIESARAAGGADYVALSYQEIADDPSRVSDRAFDAIVFNFALLGDPVAPLLRATRSLLQPDGVMVVQTIHPWAVGVTPYADGWQTEDFSALGGGFPEPMPWFFRTLSSWTEQLASARLAVVSTQEPAHPDTDRSLSLILVAAPLEDETVATFRGAPA